MSVTIYKDGVPHEATPEERAVLTSSEAPYKGCPVFVISRGFKYWCQRGGKDHEGTHSG